MDARTTQKYAAEALRIAKGGNGSGATATATLQTTGAIRSATIKAGGSGYSVNDVLTVATGTGGTFRVTSIGAGGAVTGILQIAKGSGYANVDGAATTVAPAGGSGCTLVTVCEFGINTIAVGAGGANYITADVYFSGGGGDPTSPALATATVTGGAVASIAIDTSNRGKFLTAPTVTVSGAPKSGTNLIAQLKAYDDSLQNARIKALLEDVSQIEILNGDVVSAALAAL